MWKASAYHRETGITFRSDARAEGAALLVALTVNLGIGSNENSIGIELAGKVELRAGTFDVSFQFQNEPAYWFYGFEYHTFAHNVVRGHVASTTLEATFGDIPITLEEMIEYIREHGIPETRGVNLVKVERGFTECLAEQITPNVLEDLVINRMKQEVRNPTAFFKVLETYGLGFVQTGQHSRELVFINEPVLDDDDKPVIFTEVVVGDWKFKGDVYNRAGDFLVRKIVGQSVTDASGASSFEDGVLEPAIPVQNPQVGQFNKEFTILSERDKLRNRSDAISGVEFPFNPVIRPRHLFQLEPGRGQALYLMRSVVHSFTPRGHTTSVDGTLYQLFTQPDTVVIHVERQQGRVLDVYTTPHEFLRKTLNKNDSSNPDDWNFTVNGAASAYEQLTDTGMVRDITGQPIVGDRLRAVVKAITCPDDRSESYQWHRVTGDDFGFSTVPITGATNASYIVQEEDVGFILACKVQYTVGSKRVNDTPLGRTVRAAARNVPGVAQLTIGDVDTVGQMLAVIGRAISATGVAGLFLTGAGAAGRFARITGYAMRQGLSFTRALSIATGTFRAAPLRFIGPIAGAIVPLSVYTGFHAAALINTIGVPRDDLKKLIGDAVVILTLQDYEGAVATNLVGNSMDDGTIVYNDQIQVVWEWNDDGTWKVDGLSAQTHRYHNLISVMDYTNQDQVDLVESGHFLVAALFPGKHLAGKEVRATIRPYYDHMNPVPGTSIELYDTVPPPPNPSITTEPVTIPATAIGGLDIRIEPAEPATGFQANSGEAVTVVMPQSQRNLISKTITAARINVTRFNDAQYTQVDDTFDDNLGQISGFPPLSYVFQAAEANKPEINDAGKWFEFRLEFIVGEYHFLSEPVRLKNAVRSV